MPDEDVILSERDSERWQMDLPHPHLNVVRENPVRF